MRQHLRGDRGQTIFLAPVGFIIVLLLGGVVLEAGNLHLRQRQLDNLADSAASDAAGGGIDTAYFRDTGMLRVNEDAATIVVLEAVGFSDLNPVTVALVEPAGSAGLRVDLQYDHEFIFARQIFGISQTLEATGNAELMLSG